MKRLEGYLGGALGGGEGDSGAWTAGRLPVRPAHLRGGAAAPRTRGSSGRPPRPAGGGSGPSSGSRYVGATGGGGVSPWRRGSRKRLGPRGALARRVPEFRGSVPAGWGGGPGPAGEVSDGGWRGREAHVGPQLGSRPGFPGPTRPAEKQGPVTEGVLLRRPNRPQC